MLYFTYEVKTYNFVLYYISKTIMTAMPKHELNICGLNSILFIIFKV